MNVHLNQVSTVTVARLALGLVWFYQGIVPKLLWPITFELEIIERSSLYLFTPRVMMFLVGLFETSLGVWILSGFRGRYACLAATFFMLLLQSIVIVVEPSLLIGPFGGLTKNIGLVALAWIVWRDGKESDARTTALYFELFNEAWAALRARRCVVRAVMARLRT